MMSIFWRAMRPVLLVLVLFVVACDALVDVPTGPGLVIQDLSGSELVRVEGNTVRGSLQIPAGERLELRILLLDEAGNPRGLRSGESLRGTITILATFQMVGDGSAVLQAGRTRGTTKLELDILTGGMVEHVFGPIPVQVI